MKTIKENRNRTQNQINFVARDYNSLDKKSSIVESNYIGQSRQLFTLKLKNFVFIQNSNTIKSDFPCKHQLLARFHDEYQDLLYGMVASIKESIEYHCFFKFEANVI